MTFIVKLTDYFKTNDQTYCVALKVNCFIETNLMSAIWVIILMLLNTDRRLFVLQYNFRTNF